MSLHLDFWGGITDLTAQKPGILAPGRNKGFRFRVSELSFLTPFAKEPPAMTIAVFFCFLSQELKHKGRELTTGCRCNNKKAS
jgi:hypothetical protein